MENKYGDYRTSSFIGGFHYKNKTRVRERGDMRWEVEEEMETCRGGGWFIIFRQVSRVNNVHTPPPD